MNKILAEIGVREKFCSAILIIMLVSSFILFCVTSTVICSDFGCGDPNPPTTWVSFIGTYNF